jgi:hypothetical protein
METLSRLPFSNIKPESNMTKAINELNAFISGLEGNEREKQLWYIIQSHHQWMRSKFENEEEDSQVFEEDEYEKVPKGSKIRAPTVYQTPGRPVQWYRKGSTEDPEVNYALMNPNEK